MILVFDDKKLYEKFGKEMKGACIYQKKDSEVFGEGVSSEDYVNRACIGASIPFYVEIFRKQVAQKAIDNDVVLLDCDPNIPGEVKKCPVIYITERTEGNDEEFGQLPVKYAGSVEATMIAAKEKMKYWLEKYGENRSEKDYYRDFLEASVSRLPDRLRIIAVERLMGQYVAGLIVDFSEENIPNISKCIEDTEKAGYAVFVDDRVDVGFFNIEDYYFTVLEAESTDKFIDLCNTLKEENERVIRDIKTIRNAVDKNVEEWKKEIHDKIYLKHEGDPNRKNYNKIPRGYIRMSYNLGDCELTLDKLGIKAEIDDVVFLKMALEYIEKELKKLGGNVTVEMYFYGQENMEDLLPKK